MKTGWNVEARNAVRVGFLRFARGGAQREHNGSRLPGSRQDKPEARPQITPVERAIGVTEKRSYIATIELDQRKIRVPSFVGHIAGDWRVLFVTAY